MADHRTPDEFRFKSPEVSKEIMGCLTDVRQKLKKFAHHIDH